MMRGKVLASGSVASTYWLLVLGLQVEEFLDCNFGVWSYRFVRLKVVRVDGVGEFRVGLWKLGVAGCRAMGRCRF